MEQSPTFFDPTLFLLFGFMILIYFLMIRPENKRRKTHQEMLASIEVGEEIVTAGGILGKVSKISDQYLELSISEDTKIKVQKTSISAVLPKGTLKSI
jgi:preprotein translocase subunit YajC|uniref:Preprotein translocase YajC subunit n=1 Tax=uncultured marine bacterium EB0_39H12 TaxID=415437 RepID=A4GHV2_9BACT|nr:preprotein translocase YajC subunit [uncultured marine bacterium EB0_39H12]|tara:strand:+ start:4717 stop:5010 length:294 start_codon:yes stop_codon:yes gene_type:complete